ncbi:hypothetical protein [Yinghuangia soli]|uniref:Lipoprotein n=1 Tax=Yinghuangia soli TaxID=2908204 RepID=A0AA41Q2W0_9ACTN|nr:hypothetical protein [Yinghuangia soli]MCF2530530.1 hypothetical protein [Yinghuangia soli]
MRDAGPTRRTVLAGLGAFAALGLGATACTSDDSSGRTPAQRKAEDEIRGRAQDSAAALLDRYDAVFAAHPALAGGLRPYADEIALHLAAFGGTRPTPAPGAPPAEPVPADAPGALADLARREQQGVDGRLVDLPAAGPDLARLLASVAAAQSVHVRQLSTAA